MNKHTIRRPLLQMLLSLGLVLMLTACGAEAVREHQTTKLTTNDYDSFLLSMFADAPFSEQDFEYYIGRDTRVINVAIQDEADLCSYLKDAYSTVNTIKDAYLVIDPERLTMSKGRGTLLGYIRSKKSTTFHFLLPCPSLAYLQQRTEDEINHAFEVYKDFITKISAYSNATAYYAGYEEWLLINRLNYREDLYSPNQEISCRLALFTFCDNAYVITPENADTLFDATRQFVADQTANPTHYPDLSGMTLVYFGDDIIASPAGSYSIPGYISGLTGAAYESYAGNGSTACYRGAKSKDFLYAVGKYLGEKHKYDTEVCFVLNFGLNDYSAGKRLDDMSDPESSYSYAGALRKGIERLRKRYSDARFIIMSPTPTTFYNNGTDPLGPNGETLDDYVNTARRVARSSDCIFLNNYTDLGIDLSNLLTYSGDGCHFNELGRLHIARSIIERLSQNLQ